MEKTFESPLYYKEIKPVNPKGNQPLIFIRRTYAELQYFGYLIQRTNSLVKTLLLGKIEGGKRRGQKRKRWLDGITDSMDMGLGRLQQLVDGQGGLVCCGSWGRKESDMTEQLN